MKKIVTVLGARPQFIKSAPVSKALDAEGIEEVIIHTGQHFDANMSQVFFEEMKLRTPKYNLDIHSLSHSAMTGRMMEEIEKILISEDPEGVLVYGDTNSTLAGALAAKKLKLQLGHVEAGLRSYNRQMPEEINRITTDHISDFLFGPTRTSVEIMEKEGLDENATIVLAGDVMYDAFLQFKPQAIKPEVESPYILLTLHRQENIDDELRLGALLEQLNDLSEKHNIIFPVHPRARKAIEGKASSKITLIDPVGYLEMMGLLSNCELVMTDSGGLQKEAYFSRKYCITLRNESEWSELVDGGYNFLLRDLDELSTLVERYVGKKITEPTPYYGMGNAGEIIAQVLSGKAFESEGKGGLPERDLKKNLGCG